MAMLFRFASVLSAGLLLAGCATTAPTTQALQDQPLAPAAFRISALGDSPGAAERLASAALAAKGLRPASASEAPGYVVQVSYSSRARHVGAYVPDEAGVPTWLEKGSERWSLAKGVATLGVRVFEPASGREAYVARVSRPFRKDEAGELEALMDAALDPLKIAQP